MLHYEIFISVDGQKGVVRVGSSYPPIKDTSSAINYALELTQSCYPDSKVEFEFIKEYLLDDEPDVGYVFENPLRIYH